MKDGPKKCYTKIPQSNVASFTSDMKKEGKKKVFNPAILGPLWKDIWMWCLSRSLYQCLKNWTGDRTSETSGSWFN